MRAKYSDVCPADHGARAPLARVSPGSGTTSSGSTSMVVPMPVQTGHADPGVELVRVVGDVVEVMLEPGLANELVDCAHGRQRIACQALGGLA